jgi:uncharacterized sulfatase
MALPLDAVTIAESLSESGYRTGYVGKWHLGVGDGYHPSQQGYDFAAVINGPHLPGKFQVHGNAKKKPRADQYRTDFEAELSVDFIQRNRDRPFFLMVSPFAVHIPLAAMSNKVEKYRRRAEQRNVDLPHPVYAAMVEHCDDLVGGIVAAIDAAGLTQNTMIVFTSDNGGLIRRYDYQPAADNIVASLAPLKGEKGSLHEGGIRVPLIVQYPPLIEPGGICAEPAVSHDFFPTFAALAKSPLPKNQTLDGKNLLPLFDNPRAQLEREAIYWHYPHYHHDRPASCIRKRDWKLLEYLDGSGDIELYKINEDIGETVNLVAQDPERVRRMRRELQAWRQSVGARMPISNPSHNPQRAPEWWNLLTGQPVPSLKRTRFPETER